MEKITRENKAVKEVTPKEAKTPATVEIVCVECGTSRTIGKGEAFQVKRCKECQEKHRKQLRKGYRKNRVQSLKGRIQILEALLSTNNIEIPE